MEKYFLAAIQSVEGIGSATLKRLINYFNTAKEVWYAKEDDLKASKCLSLNILEKFLKYRQNFDIDNLINQCQQDEIKIATIFDDDYPQLLKHIYNPPMALFYKGNINIGDNNLAIVGSRQFSPYGKNVALNIAQDLASNGYTIVSGAAYGIDTFAHQGALSKGKTIAVLGCGVNIYYPRENQKLLERIKENGAIISEYLPNTRPLPAFFPARNRIISGMSKGTLVVEAAKKSGSLITAELALNEGRDVFAIPGSIYVKSSAGCNYLIQQGAKLVTSAEDILVEYGKNNIKISENKKNVLTFEEKKIYDILTYEQGISIDESEPHTRDFSHE